MSGLEKNTEDRRLDDISAILDGPKTVKHGANRSRQAQIDGQYYALSSSKDGYVLTHFNYDKNQKSTFQIGTDGSIIKEEASSPNTGADSPASAEKNDQDPGFPAPKPDVRPDDLLAKLLE
jgi:hypothetical protein